MLLSLLLFVVITIWTPVINSTSNDLTVTFLDVGQGDSILVETPSGRQILIDGGRDNTVLKELSKAMSFWDRSIAVVIATHPDADHIAGLVEVLKRFKVDTYISPGVLHDTPATKALFRELERENATEILARRGQVYDFGDGVNISILFPDRDVEEFESNAASIILKVTYGENSFLLTGDSPKHIEKYLISLNPDELKANVLKAGHHGSKTSSDALFVGFTGPQYAVFSRGCDNSYGHPSEEVVRTFKDFGVETIDTCLKGSVVFKSDGKMVTIDR